MEKFIHRNTVTRFRQLLQSNKLDQNERETILKLLAAEEEKLTTEGLPPESARSKR